MPAYPGHIDSKLPHVGTTIFTVMSRLALEHDAINLSQGFPDFDCAQALRDLFTRAINSGLNQYPPMAGVPVLRERIGEKMQALYGLAYDPEHEITVVPGATYGIFTAVATFIRPGDEVILFEPAYDSYEPAVSTAGGKPALNKRINKSGRSLFRGECQKPRLGKLPTSDAVSNAKRGIQANHPNKSQFAR